ncbi:translocating chain-associated membrane protein 1-like 1 isoform X2 [Ptychodera flava]|uniref:translocating chain-associated membrane protein 1-like 1 isoform X2 n=1 Tax=Ptychodera flava TaxID=63121 RepID=UPI003969CA2F
MGIRRKIGSSKNPPILSHEFVIQNHADIVSCVAMVFVLGLMFQWSSPYASMFVAMQHNVTHVFNDTEIPDVTNYTCGKYDIFTIFFYLLVCVIIHAVVQEYILDKLNRRMHLSKVKHSKFNESGQLLFFYLVSAGWGADIAIRERYLLNLSSLWDGYPHTEMSFLLKFYFSIQIAYWIHIFPELYFQKIKKEDMGPRIRYATLYLVFITGAYAMNLTRLALVCLIIHYLVEALFHFARLMYFSDKNDIAKPGFFAWAVMFVIARFTTVTLAVLMFWFRLSKAENQEFDRASGNFNTPLIRFNVLSAICFVQAWMMWNFITFQLRRRREYLATVAPKKKAPGKAKEKKPKKEDKRSEKKES